MKLTGSVGLPGGGLGDGLQHGKSLSPDAHASNDSFDMDFKKSAG
jgi:hypothetical protein